MTSTTENVLTENVLTKNLEISKIESDRELILETIINEVHFSINKDVHKWRHAYFEILFKLGYNELAYNELGYN